MRNMLRPSLILIASVGLALAACDSGSGTGTTDTNVGADVTTDAPGGNDVTSPEPDAATDTAMDTVMDTATDAGPTDVAEDVPAADPCDPNPCLAKAAECVGTVATTYTTPGTCTAVDGAATCEFATDQETDCTADSKVCSNGACVDGGDPSAYTFSDQASFVKAMRIPGKDDDPCCFDYTGDGAPDNALGGLLGLVAQFAPGTDVNGMIQSSIADGTIAILLEYVGLDAANAAADADLTMNGFYGAYATFQAGGTTPDYDTALTGEGHFTVDPNSFIEGTATPLISFAGAKIQGGVLTAGPSLFTLNFPLMGMLLSASVNGTQIEANVTAQMTDSASGLQFNDAKLGGYVKAEELAGAINAIMNGCTCLGLSTDLITFDPYATKPKLACDADAQNQIGSNTCTPDDGICNDVATNISIVCLGAGFISLDVDSDDNGFVDSISVGVRLDGVAATIDGLTPAPAL